MSDILEIELHNYAIMYVEPRINPKLLLFKMNITNKKVLILAGN